MLGNHLSEETKIKLSNLRKGIKFSKEHRKKISNATKNYINTHPNFISEISSKPVLQFDLLGNLVCEYCNAREVKEWGFSNKYVGQVCNGKRDKYKGYFWRWKYE